MPSEICETIAGQLHHMKPDWVIPGKNVGMRELVEGTLEIWSFESDHVRRSRVTYDHGADLYNVELSIPGEDDQVFEGVYCDQLGELVWGEDAKEWTQPFGQLVDLDTGDVISEW